MNILFTISVIILLLVLAWQDFRHRLISWVPLALLFILFVVRSVSVNSWREASVYFGINAFMLFIQLAALTLYYTIKHRRFASIIDTSIGLGDILFFVLLCISFSPVNFFSFYITSLIFSAAIFILLKRINLIKTTEVPLAGLMSIMLILVLLVKNIVHSMDLYNDYWVLDFFKTNQLTFLPGGR